MWWNAIERNSFGVRLADAVDLTSIPLWLLISRQIGYTEIRNIGRDWISAMQIQIPFFPTSCTLNADNRPSIHPPRGYLFY